MQNAKLILLSLLALRLSPAYGDETAPDGQTIFNRACAACHGAAGAGGRGPSLRGPLQHGNQSADIRRVIQNGVPGTGMPKFRFLPAEMTGLVSYVQSLSRGSGSAPAAAGNRIAGKQVYEKQGCARCHKIGKEGSAYGPNLSQIGSLRSYEFLKTSILNPSAEVPEKYQGVTVTTSDGKQHKGVRVNEDTFTLQLRLPDQSFASFDKQTLQNETVEKESPMPAYLMSGDELKNLLAYLSSLKAPATGATKGEPVKR